MKMCRCSPIIMSNSGGLAGHKRGRCDILTKRIEFKRGQWGETM